ncbi:MAG: potassium channel family protein, partial [Armatimonadota bacterium]|nr:potassium channel family protein [Armatimonadota bacterium]
MDPFKQLRFAFLVVFAIIALGVLGYTYIEHMPLLDSLYMTVITITTVGFREVRPLSSNGKIFTIVLCLMGVSTVFAVVFWMISNAMELAA